MADESEDQKRNECQGADFSKLMTHLGEQLRAHAERDELTGVRLAVFLARGGHAPGDVCPSEQPPSDPHEYWCSWPEDECNCPAAIAHPDEYDRREEMSGPEWPPRVWAGTPAIGMCPDCGYPIVETPDRRDARHDHCGPLPHTGPAGGPYCDRCR